MNDESRTGVFSAPFLKAIIQKGIDFTLKNKLSKIHKMKSLFANSDVVMKHLEYERRNLHNPILRKRTLKFFVEDGGLVF